jgi:hypothetical protein
MRLGPGKRKRGIKDTQGHAAKIRKRKGMYFARL